MGLAVYTAAAEAPTDVIVTDTKTRLSNVLIEDLDELNLVEERAQKIDAYYDQWNLPLSGYGRVMVEEAMAHGIDWRLVAAIGMRESTGGKFACQTVDYSAFGWGSCKINFDSYEHSIAVISQNLGGHNPRTATYYANKDLVGILEAYNPPTIKPGYARDVIRIMDEIQMMS